MSINILYYYYNISYTSINLICSPTMIIYVYRLHEDEHIVHAMPKQKYFTLIINNKIEEITRSVA